MVDINERMIGIDPLLILSNCKNFIGSAWDELTEDNYDFKVLTQGFGNRLFVVGAKEGHDIEPKKVLVRYYGGNFLPPDAPMRTLTETGEVLVFYALGEKGIGPKLWGSFAGGRVEEYIPSRILTLEEFLDDQDISQAIAQNLAKFHAVNIPVVRKPWDIPALLRKSYAKFLASSDKLSSMPPPPNEAAADVGRQLFSFPVLAEADWVERVIRELPTRVVFAHNDLNRSNMIYKSDQSASKSLSDRIVIVDYEFCGYNYRGADIGNHFGMRVFDFGSDKFLTQKPYPEDKVRIRFIENYLIECKKLNIFDDWDDSGRDSVDSVLLETDFFAAICRLINIAWMMGEFEHFAKMSEKRKSVDEDFDASGGPTLSFMQFYSERKAAFLQKYPQFA